MFRFQFTNVKQLHDFLSVNDVDYVDVFLGAQSKLVTHTIEVYAELNLSVQRSEGQKDLQFRVSKALLNFVNEDDLLSVVAEGGEIHLLFLDGRTNGIRYECSFLSQIVAQSLYADKFGVCENLKLNKFNVAGLAKISRIAKYCSGAFNVIHGVASVITKEGIRIFKEVDVPESFSISVSAFECLKKCDSNIGSWQGYLVASRDDFNVIVRKLRVEYNEEYGILKERKFGAHFTANLEITGLLRFLARTKLSLDSVVIDVKQACCRIEAMRSQLFIPVEFKNVNTTGKLEQLALPAVLLTKVIPNLGVSEIAIRVTKNFIQVKALDYVIVW